MNNNQRQAIINYLEQGSKFSDLLIRELEREDITDPEKRTYSSLLDAVLGATELYCFKTDWPDNVDIFISNQQREPKKDTETAITIKHGPLTVKKANEISEILRELPLDNGQNDRLITMMNDMLLMAEHEQYIAGFSECTKTVRDSGFKGLEDKLNAIMFCENEKPN